MYVCVCVYVCRVLAHSVLHKWVKYCRKVNKTTTTTIIITTTTLNNNNNNNSMYYRKPPHTKNVALMTFASLLCCNYLERWNIKHQHQTTDDEAGPRMRRSFAYIFILFFTRPHLAVASFSPLVKPFIVVVFLRPRAFFPPPPPTPIFPCFLWNRKSAADFIQICM